MKPFIYFSPKLKNDNFEGTRLRKNIKGALELKNIVYAKNELDDFDIAHFISLDDEDKIEETINNGILTVFSALYCEDDPKAKICSMSKNGELEINSKTIKLLNKIDCVFVPSLEAKELLEKNNINTRIEIVTPGVNLSRFKFKNSVEDDIFYEYFQIEKDNKYVVTTGNFENDSLELIINIANLCPEYKFFYIVTSGKKIRRFRQKKCPKNLKILSLVNSEIYCSMLKSASFFILVNTECLSPLILLDVMASKTQIISLGKSLLNSNLLIETRVCVCENLKEVVETIKNSDEDKNIATVNASYDYAKSKSLNFLGNDLIKYYKEILED